MSWLARLEGTAAAMWMRESSWGYPAVEVVHLLGLALLIGAAGMWDLRLLGVARHIPVSALAGYLLPGARAGFAVAVASGTLLFSSDAVALSSNPAFRVKLAVIAAALVNISVFHARAFGTVATWDAGARPPIGARVAAALSILLWVMAVVAGRWIAYV
jgi:hypothetical protein